MDLTRRGFFGVLAALPFIKRFVPLQYCPAPTGMDFGAINATTMQYLAPAISDQYFASGPLLAYMRDHNLRVTAYEGDED